MSENITSELVFEYRVVCDDGEWRYALWRRPSTAEEAMELRWQANAACRSSYQGKHNHTIECRTVGPWGRDEP